MSQTRPTPSAVNLAVLAQLRELAPRWAPGGRFEGDEYLARNPNRADQNLGSFKLNVRTGFWSDFATGDRGRDPIGYYAYLTQSTRLEATRALGGSLGVEGEKAARRDIGASERGRGGSILFRRESHVQSPGLTLDDYATAKRLPVELLERLGLTDGPYLGSRALRIPYLDAGRRSAAMRFRLRLEKGETDDRFRWRKGDKPLLYGLWRLRREDADVVLVEGESDCHTLWLHGVNALGVPGASTWKEDRDASHIEGFDRIFIVVEPGQSGAAMLDWLARSRIRTRAWLLRLGETKDPSALHIADPDLFMAHWRAAVDAAKPWADHHAKEQAADRGAAYAQCRALATEPDILARFYQDLTAAGVVGEERLAKLVYLAATSRLLDRPVSLAVKGPSSGGKSFVTGRTLDFFPEEAIYKVTAMSERALAYGAEPLAHRMIVLAEAAGASGEFGQYLLRSLLSEGRLIYETVDKKGGGELVARRIEREGPTGLIVTTTRQGLHPENETRMLSVEVEDSAEHTAAILREQARQARSTPDLSAWLALQQWLSRSSSVVVVPFAEALAELVPPTAVRLRRDFPTVLSLIRAHALLHQATRARDAEGAVVADLADYAAVRSLVADIVAAGVEQSVRATVRQTVEVVKRLAEERADKGEAEGVANKAVAAALSLDRSAATRRLQACEAAGYLENLSESRGKPSRWIVAAPMPEDEPVLPDLKSLADALAWDG